MLKDKTSNFILNKNSRRKVFQCSNYTPRQNFFENFSSESAVTWNKVLLEFFKINKSISSVTTHLYSMLLLYGFVRLFSTSTIFGIRLLSLPLPKYLKSLKVFSLSISQTVLGDCCEFEFQRPFVGTRSKSNPEIRNQLFAAKHLRRKNKILDLLKKSSEL